MTPALHPYPAYKPSGIDWLGDVPEHWEVRRLRDSTTDCVNGVWGNDPNGVDDLPCVRVADFDRQRLRVREAIPTIRAIAPTDRRRRMLQSGDLLMEKSGGGERQPVGVVMLFDHGVSAVCSNFVARVPVREGFDPNYLTFLHFTLYSLRLNTRSIKQTTGIQNLDSDAYLAELVGFPPLSEQAAIARYLDYVDRRVRRYVEAKRKLIALLEEKRQAVIHQAVTRGLDPNVPLKPSGVEWLGDIPANWEVRTLGKLAVSFRTGPFGSVLHQSDYVEDGTPVINPIHMRGGTIVEDSDCSVPDAIAERLSSYRLDLHDLIFARRGELGRCSLVRSRETGWLCGTGSIRVRIDYRKVEPEFLIRALQGPWVGKSLSLASVGATMDNLNTGILKGVPVLVPPIQEQRHLLEFIAQKSSDLDAAIERARRQIELLEEYRTRLIADVVTGKLDVRAAAESLPDEEDNREPKAIDSSPAGAGGALVPAGALE